MKPIEHSRIITNIEAKSITEKEYQRLEKISTHISKYIKQELKMTVTDIDAANYILSLLIKSKYYNSLSSIEKEIIIGKILLPDDIEIVDILNQNHYTIDNIKPLIRFRTTLKQILQYKSPLTESLKKEITTYLKLISPITEIFKQKYNIDDETTILNRICEIFVRYPNYFEYTEFIPPHKK